MVLKSLPQYSKTLLLVKKCQFRFFNTFIVFLIYKYQCYDTVYHQWFKILFYFVFLLLNKLIIYTNLLNQLFIRQFN